MDLLTLPFRWIVDSTFGNMVAAVCIVMVLIAFLGRKLFSRSGIIAVGGIIALVIGGGAVYRWMTAFDGPGFVFFQGNGATQSNVCNLSDAPATISLNNHPCPNDQIRSVKLLKLKAGTILRVFDNVDGKLEDDWAEIVVLKDVGEYVISSFAAPQNDDTISVHFSRNNSLDGKISRLQVTRDDRSDGSDLSSTVAFYEGDNLTQNKVCELPLKLPTEMSFQNGAECDNDEAHSMLLRNVPANTRLRLYDDPGGNRNDDWLDIVVLQQMAELRLPTLEMNEEKPTHRIQYHRNNGLQGKVSRLKIEAGGPEPLVVLYEGNGGSQNIVCTISLISELRGNVKDFGCPNDEARSAVLYNVPHNTSIRLFDNPSLGKNDDWVEIFIRQTVVMEKVPSFQRNLETQNLTVHSHRQNGLHGKVSAIEMVRAPHEPVIDLFEGNNASQNRVCSVIGSTDRLLNFKSGSNGGCANDEARSMVLHRMPVGTVIRVYDNQSGNTQDDWSEIQVMEQHSFITVPSFQGAINSGHVRLRYFRNNGLDGLVSRLEIGSSSIATGILSFYEGNNGSQNKVCDLEAIASGKVNFRNGSRCKNDETRSVIITNVKAGYSFSVFDDPACKTGDDWTQIEVLQDADFVILKTFQKTLNTAALRVTYNRKNGLDGKVSCVRFGQ